MDFHISLHADLLLLNQSHDKVILKYLDFIFKIPMIGRRPPYYTNPRYVLNYSIL